MQTYRKRDVHQAINVFWVSLYAMAIGPAGLPIAATIAVCSSLALVAHIGWLRHFRNQTLASVERRAALIRAANGHPECERLVQRALATTVTDADVIRIFRQVCELHDSARRSLVTRRSELTVAECLRDGHAREG
jgi:hypothetical protein